MARSRKKEELKDAPTRKRRRVMGIEKFSSDRSAKRYAEVLRNKEKQKIRNAALVKEYKKAMKEEGFSSKRINSSDKKGKSGNVKVDKFEKEKKEAERRQADREEAQKRREQKEVENSRKLAERKERHSKLRARTRKGQPLMKNVVSCMLEKIQNDMLK